MLFKVGRGKKEQQEKERKERERERTFKVLQEVGDGLALVVEQEGLVRRLVLGGTAWSGAGRPHRKVDGHGRGSKVEVVGRVGVGRVCKLTGGWDTRVW